MKGTLPRGMNRKVGRAMHDYEMLADGDRILVAVSGGIDSLILSWLLLSWEKKHPSVTGYKLFMLIWKVRGTFLVVLRGRSVG